MLGAFSLRIFDSCCRVPTLYRLHVEFPDENLQARRIPVDSGWVWGYEDPQVTNALQKQAWAPPTAPDTLDLRSEDLGSLLELSGRSETLLRAVALRALQNCIPPLRASRQPRTFMLPEATWRFPKKGDPQELLVMKMTVYWGLSFMPAVSDTPT